MNKLGIGFIIVIALVIIGFSFQDMFSPQPQKAEKMQIESINWDAKNQEFIVELSVKSGITKEGENEDFIISTTLSVHDEYGKLLFHGVMVESNPHLEVIDPLDSMILDGSIPWDRNGGKFEGLVDVTVETQILNSARKTVEGPVSYTEFNIDIMKD